MSGQSGYQRRSARPIRVLVVAAPFVSRAGVYTSLRRTLPVVMQHGVEVGVLWSSRVPGGEMPGDWVKRVTEPAQSALRQGALIRELSLAVKRWRPDVLLSVLPQSDIACAAIARIKRVAWIAMIRGRPFPIGDEAPMVKKMVWKSLVRLAYESATMRIAVSAGLAEEIRNGIGVEVDRVVHNGVDVDEYPFRPRSAGERQIGFIGRLTEAKAPLVVCEIARELDRPVEIIGDGPLKGDIVRIAAGDPRVRFRGWLPSSEAMRKVDILVVPSVREAFGNVILEAGASGVVPIARRAGGVPEILGRDELISSHCLVSEQADALEFAAAVRRLEEDPLLRSELARRLHALVGRDFSVESAGIRLGDLIEEVGHRRK
jgi:glycosyltransferase involved in cell wall biosynthesis